MKRTRIGAILIICMTFLLPYTQPSYAAEVSNESIGADDLKTGTEKLYKTYYDKLIELQGQYGSAEIVSGAYESRLSGLCFARLVDFNNDGVDELLLSYLACIDEYGYPKYILEVWEYNGGELEKVFEGDCNFSEEIYNSIKLYAYGNQYYIGQCIMDVDEYVRWWGENSELEWTVGLALFGYVDDAFVPVQSSFYGYDVEYNEMHFLNGERISEENIQDSENYRQWLEYIESPETFLLTCDSSGSELEETLSVLDNTFSILCSEPAEDNVIE